MINVEAKISYSDALVKQFGNELLSRLYQLYRIQTSKQKSKALRGFASIITVAKEKLFKFR